MKQGSFLYRFIYESCYSVYLCCVAYLLISMALFLATGLFSAQADALGFESSSHLLGLVLLMVGMPTWLIGCMFVTQRHSLQLARQMDSELAAKVSLIPLGYVTLGLAGGLVYGLAFNVPPSQYALVFAGNVPMIGIFLGQLLVWVFVGWMLAVRLYVGHQFFQCGKTIPVNLFEQSTLAPFARIGLLDVVIVVGCLAVSTVQSIDAQFRLENYLAGIALAIPAAIALLVRPMWTVHRRLAEQKRQLNQEVLLQIRAMPHSNDLETLAALETLLSRRDRVRALPTWPLDVAIWSRLFFYGLIPPLAWVGAALVEMVIERFIAG